MLILTSVTLVNSQKGSKNGRYSPSIHESQFIRDMVLSSSPPSHVPAGQLPSPPNSNSSPLGSPSLQTAQSTTLESLRSLPRSSPQPDWLEKSLLLQTSSPSNDAPLLLGKLRITSLSKPNDVGMSPKVDPNSTGSCYPDRDRPPSLLDAATVHPQHLLCQAADGTVQAGTLEGLLDRLVTETHDRAKDDEVQRIFIATYRLFTTGEELFRILKRRFDEMGELSHAKASIRYS